MDQAAATQPIRARLARRLKISPARVAAFMVAVFACLMLAMVTASGVAGTIKACVTARSAHKRPPRFTLRAPTATAGKKYELAMAEFEYVLQIAPEYPEAAELLAETRRRMIVVPTPTPKALTIAVSDIFKQGQAAFQAKDWPKPPKC